MYLSRSADPCIGASNRRQCSFFKEGYQGNVPGTPKVVYVDQQVGVSGDGSSWAQAYKTLSEALGDAADSLTTDGILVAAGTYNPTGHQTSMNGNEVTFHNETEGLNLLGGLEIVRLQMSPIRTSSINSYEFTSDCAFSNGQVGRASTVLRIMSTYILK